MDTQYRVGHNPYFSDTAAGDKIDQDVCFLPYDTEFWFPCEGSWFFFQHDPKYRGSNIPIIELSCLGQSREPFAQLFRKCREVYNGSKTECIIYSHCTGKWLQDTRKQNRSLETVVMNGKTKDDVVTRCRRFLSKEAQEQYKKIGKSHQLGLLFYGPPGTGKTSLVFSLASRFSLPIYVLRLTESLADDGLERLFREVPPYSIILIEDIDVAHGSRRRDSQKSQPGVNNRPGVSLATLLNEIDGVGTKEDRIIVITTNDGQSLDPALLRPGRLDMHVPFMQPDESSLQNLFSPHIPGKDGFGNLIFQQGCYV
ncbi:hypothetical protein PG994_006929 [Apiospora phragmitis]|uniref:AAA+ ATPase domain-containing protein n=1 Tax=Apiospora phragmitis TaxID=2905665 RepID=A0ABR1VGK3_9PEZI